MRRAVAGDPRRLVGGARFYKRGGFAADGADADGSDFCGTAALRMVR